MGLVDHHDVVVRQDLDAGDGVDREQCVVGDHYVGLRRLDSGALGEAVLTDRALVLTDAFAGGDTDLPPRLIGYARHQFVPITCFGVGGPFGEADDLPAETRDRERIEQLVLGWLFGRAGVDLVHAQVVVAALEDCKLGASAEWLLQCIGEPWQISIDELALKRDGGGGHDNGAPRLDRVAQARNEVGERLTGTRAGLDGQMLAGVDRVRHGGRHRQLTGSFGTAERPHRCLEQFGNVRELIGHPRRLMDPYVRNVHG